MAIRFPTPSEREKRAKLIELLDLSLVTVHLDSRHTDVDVPAHLSGQPVLALNFSRAFQLPTFDVGQLAVRASLLFGGDRHLCVLPWDAIYAMTAKADGHPHLFLDDAPEEFRALFGALDTDDEAEVPAEMPAFASTEPADSESRGRPEAPVKQPAQKAPFLRLVD